MSNAAVIAGVGPGFPERLAERLGAEGYGLGLFGRSREYLDEVAADLREAGHEAVAVPTDVTDPDAVAAGVGRVRAELGPVEVLAHTASTTTGGDELDLDRFERMWRLYAYGGLCCVRAALPDLRETGGTVLFFGAAPESGDTAFRSGKDATRGLARSLADVYGPEGIQVSHVVIDGALLNPDVYENSGAVDETAYIDPAAAAETCTGLVRQDAGGWTFEVDIRAGEAGRY